eukprot:TRINITY_DN5355_c0_g1_i1.p1 TRINITY_DN5355_c0_g1~~TRINITY_DN5355_c0_g1_i1.p1  ORF type:complete len:626 (-),score=169.51 TRINITY_DN5355_c0_g1_i1:62-1888(-)
MKKGKVRKGKHKTSLSHNASGKRIKRGKHKDVKTKKKLKDEIKNEDYSDLDCEDPSGYRKGGYHPVEKGDVFKGRYIACEKLGWGHFSTVWMCWDKKTDDFCALKIQKSEKKYREAALDEIMLLDEINFEQQAYENHLLPLLDHFEIHGKNGAHLVMVFPVMGVDLLGLIRGSDYRGLPLPIVRHIVRQILIGLDYLHSKLNMIHTDLKLENVLMCHPKIELETRMEWIRMKGVETVAKEEGWTHQPQLVHSQSLEDRMASLGLDPPSLEESRKMSKSKKKRLKKKVKKLEEEEIRKDESSENGEQKEEDIKLERIARREEKDRACRAELDRLVNWGFPTGMNVAIIDFGSSCFADKPFSDVIQTRQYRSPEVIIGCGYDASADIWSLACVVFELMTGCYLFDPRKEGDITRSQDHLSLMAETLGPIPKDVALSGKFSDLFFTKTGKLRHLHEPTLFPIRDILIEEHGFPVMDATEIASFLEPMLHFRKSERATAAVCLNHPWMSEDDIAFDMERLSVNYESPGDEDDEEHSSVSSPIRRSCSEGDRTAYFFTASSSSSLRGSHEADAEALDLTSDEESTEAEKDETVLQSHDRGVDDFDGVDGIDGD